ncbi:MAG: 4-(cytidine 5'-diphospho)-2-C-methyl-D-erythritol kinase [Acidimicrobiales bacterium]
MITLRAPAKVTRYLEVTGRRADGLHELRSEMVTVELADALDVDEKASYLRVLDATGEVPDDETNLVARALRLVDRRAGVTVRKAIPVGGGLGGGSADAAAILRWAGGLSAERALSLGSDVPFCQVGGRALVEGVGEWVTPLAFERRDITLVLAPFGVDTRSCYAAYDEMRAEGWSPRGANHLEEPAGRVEPRLAVVRAWLRAEWGVTVHLAGSGSTLFIEGRVGVTPPTSLISPVGPLRILVTSTTPS